MKDLAKGIFVAGALAALAVYMIGIRHGHAAEVRASWYSEGARTATGERFNPDGMTAAHRTLPFGTRVMVTNKRTGSSVVIRVNDRGPAAWTHRSLDLSRGAARAIGMLQAGVATVNMEVLR